MRIGRPYHVAAGAMPMTMPAIDQSATCPSTRPDTGGTRSRHGRRSETRPAAASARTTSGTAVGACGAAIGPHGSSDVGCHQPQYDSRSGCATRTAT